MRLTSTAESVEQGSAPMWKELP